MSGARPSSFKKGGGFLNNVDGTILGVTYEQGQTSPIKSGKNKGEPFTPFNAILAVRQDGASEPVTTRLFIGSADDFTVEDDGETLTPAREGFGISGKSDFGRFISSVCENGFDENELPEDTINFSAIHGVRCRFVQEKDAEKTAKLGPRKDKKDPKKTYDQTQLLVSKVYGRDPGAAVATKPASGKSAGAKKGSTDTSLRDLTDATLRAVLGKATDGQLLRAKLPVKIAQALAKHAQREDVRKMAFSEEYLLDAAERGIVLYDADDDTQTVTLLDVAA